MNFDSDNNIFGFLDYNILKDTRQNSNNNNSYVKIQEFSSFDDSILSSSPFGNQFIQENDKSKKKSENKKEIIVNESKAEEVIEYFKKKDKSQNENQNEFSQLNVLKDVNKYLAEISKKENKKMFETFLEKLSNSNAGEILDLFNLKENDKQVELLKEIVLNSKFQKLLNEKEDPALIFNKVINEVFYFSELNIDINNLEKNISENSTIQTNSISITNFNEWINNYKQPSK